MNRLMFLTISLLITIRLGASEKFRHYNVTDGLSGSEVTAICENENFLWIATTDGLNRFDGSHFRVFKRESGNANSIHENSIESLMFDSRGLLWIGYKSGGVDIYDPRSDKFTRLYKFVTGEVPYRVITIFEDSANNIWLGTWEQGVYKLTPNSEGAFSFKSECIVGGYIVSCFAEYPKGKIWVGTYDGYNIYDTDTGDFLSAFNRHTIVTSFLRTDAGLWCSTWGSGLWMLGKDYTSEQLTLTGGSQSRNLPMYRMTRGVNGKIYIGTWGDGLMEIGEANVLRPLRQKGFSPSLIYSLYTDRKGNIWVGTYGDGLYKLSSQDNGISFIKPQKREFPATIGRIAGVAENKLLVGTLGGGFFLCDPTSGDLIQKFRAETGSTYENNTLAIYVDDDIVIAGHDGKGFLYCTTQEAANPNVRFRQTSGRYLEKVSAISKTSDGRIWIGTKQNGLSSVRYDKASHAFSALVHYDFPNNDEITGFAEYTSDLMWVSSHAGLFLFDIRTNKIADNGNIISGEMIYKIVKDDRNNCLWVGSSTGMSVVKFNGENKVEHPFASGLMPWGSVRDMVLDDDNNLWFIVTGRVFCKIDRTGVLREISPDAINNMTVTSCSKVSIANKEQIVFGSNDSFIAIDPVKILGNTATPKIIFTGLMIDHTKVKVDEKLNGRVILPMETEYISSLKLSYKFRWLSFSFTDVNDDIFLGNYQYRIKGLSDKWQFLDIDNTLTFSQLNPGDYILQIRVNSGNNNLQPCWSLDIHVTPPWWQSTWFYLSELIFFITAIICSVIWMRSYYRRRQTKKLREIEKRKKEELIREKENFIASLSHDLLTPLSLIVAPAKDLARDDRIDEDIREKVDIIGKNATFLSDIFGTIFDVKRAEAQETELKEKKIDAVSFVKRVVNAFDYLAGSRNIAVSFESAHESMNIVIDNVKLERILYNLISNAIKYTPDSGRITVSLSMSTGNRLIISVSDTGPGIDKRSQGQIFDKFYRESKYANDENSPGLGLGLYIVKRFVSLLGGGIEIISSPGKGTKIEIGIPVKIVEEESVLSPKSEENLKMDENVEVLIVEDNDDLRNYIKTKLSEHFNVLSASNGIEALKVIAEKMPEIVIADIMMPQMGGLELTREIKKNLLYADIFVVLLTAKSSTEDELAGYKAGADIYLKKPFDPDGLISQITNIYNTRKKRRSQLLGELALPKDGDIRLDPQEEFIKCALKVIEEHLIDADFKIDEFASEMNLSKTVLHRKFKVMVGQTPNQFIKTVRLRKSVDMLRNTDLTIAEIAYLTGFKQSHYFIKCFREAFNDTPNNFRKQNQPHNG